MTKCIIKNLAGFCPQFLGSGLQILRITEVIGVSAPPYLIDYVRRRIRRKVGQDRKTLCLEGSRFEPCDISLNSWMEEGLEIETHSQ